MKEKKDVFGPLQPPSDGIGYYYYPARLTLATVTDQADRALFDAVMKAYVRGL